MMSLGFRITAVLVCFSVAARTDPAEAWIEHHKEQTT